MKFIPQSEDANLLPLDDYNATVVLAEEKTSKSGNDMLKISLDVYGPDGEPHPVVDYLLTEGASAWKLRAFCKAAGLMEKYEAGELEREAIEGVSVCVTIGVQSETDEYPARNVVKRYQVPKTASSAPAPKPKAARAKTAKPKALELTAEDEKDVPF